MGPRGGHGHRHRQPRRARRIPGRPAGGGRGEDHYGRHPSGPARQRQDAGRDRRRPHPPRGSPRPRLPRGGRARCPRRARAARQWRLRARGDRQGHGAPDHRRARRRPRVHLHRPRGPEVRPLRPRRHCPAGHRRDHRRPRARAARAALPHRLPDPGPGRLPGGRRHRPHPAPRGRRRHRAPVPGGRPGRWLRHRLHRGRPGAAQPGAGRPHPGRGRARDLRASWRRGPHRLHRARPRSRRPDDGHPLHRHRPQARRAGGGSLSSLRQHRRRHE